MKRVRMLGHSLVALALMPVLCAGADHSRALAHAIAAAARRAQPTVVILPAASGASLASSPSGSASLSLGRAAYYGGPPAPGVTAQKSGNALLLSTRFGLRVDCGEGSASSLVEVSPALTPMDASYTVSLDGVRLSSTSPPTVLRCGSVTEHIIQVEVPKTRPPGPFASSLSFSATPKY